MKFVRSVIAIVLIIIGRIILLYPKISNYIEQKNQIEFKILVSDPYNANIERRLKNVEKFSKQDALERQWKTIYEDNLVKYR